MPDNVQRAVTTIEINEECLVAEICIDRYLWALYERAPKVDAIKVHEQRKVTIKRKGKTKTVTRTFTRRVDEDFTWKDRRAAEEPPCRMMDYVIGHGRSSNIAVHTPSRCAEQAGLQPGITQRVHATPTYRQGIASGLEGGNSTGPTMAAVPWQLWPRACVKDNAGHSRAWDIHRDS